MGWWLSGEGVKELETEEPCTTCDNPEAEGILFTDGSGYWEWTCDTCGTASQVFPDPT